MAELLRATGITKRFTGALALDGVDFDVRSGEVHVLLGENGAGKSTLVKVLAGVYQPDYGSVVLADGVRLAVIYQELTLVPELSVAENLFLGRPRRRGAIPRVARPRAGEPRLVSGAFGERA